MARRCVDAGGFGGLAGCAAALVLASSLGCGGRAVYPPEHDPGDVDWARGEGLECTSTTGAPCRDLDPGHGPRLGGHGLATVRVSASDPATGGEIGSVVTSFLHPPLRSVVFRGRDRDVSPSMFGDAPAGGWRTEGFLHLHEAGFFGPYTVGMRVGGRRQFSATFHTTSCPDERRCFILADATLPDGAPGLAVPPDRVLAFTLRLEEFCYPRVYLRTWFHFQFPGDEKLVPRLVVRGCGV